jgi:serine/threonine protein kinase
MAPESLNLGLFTPASDIWSFGVLIYEITTFGAFPFQGMTNNQVLEYVKSGNHLDIPPAVKPQLEGLMKACWNLQHKKRPSAHEVLEYISNYPRLLTPCLDVPLASVQLPENDCDQIELLPGIRKRSVTPIGPATEVTKSINLNNFDLNSANKLPTSYLSSLNIQSRGDDGSTENSTVSAMGNYNPVEPLLQQQHKDNPEISKSNSSLLLRYVPMCGFGKNKTPSIDSECRSVQHTSAL